MEEARSYVHSLFKQLSTEYDSGHLVLDMNDESNFAVDDMVFHLHYNDEYESIEVTSAIGHINLLATNNLLEDLLMVNGALFLENDICFSISPDRRIVIQTKWHIWMLESMQDIGALLNTFVESATYLKTHLCNER